MSDSTAFRANPASTVSIAASTTLATNVALNRGNPCSDMIRIVGGTTDCRIEFGKDASVAVVKPVAGVSAGSMTIKAGSVEVMTVPPNTAYVAAACDSGSATLEFTPGVGL